jgi:hypothetical protein
LIFRFDLFFILVDDCNEVTDYAIARRIIDLHTKLEESVERIYSEDEVQLFSLKRCIERFCDFVVLLFFQKCENCMVLPGVAVSSVCANVQTEGGDGSTGVAGPAIQTPQASGI